MHCGFFIAIDYQSSFDARHIKALRLSKNYFSRLNRHKQTLLLSISRLPQKFTGDFS